MIRETMRPVRNPRLRGGTGPRVTGTTVLVRLQPEQLQEIDAWRREQDNLPSRAEAIRRLAAGRFAKRGRR
jgi:hypothetical protein